MSKQRFDVCHIIDLEWLASSKHIIQYRCITYCVGVHSQLQALPHNACTPIVGSSHSTYDLTVGSAWEWSHLVSNGESPRLSLQGFEIRDEM